MMKKWVSVLLTLILALSACLTVYAGSEVIEDLPGSVGIPVTITVNLPDNYFQGPVEDGKVHIEGDNFTASGENAPDGAVKLVVVPVTEEEALSWFNGNLPEGWGGTGTFYAVWYENEKGERLPAAGVRLRVKRPSGYNGTLNVYSMNTDGEGSFASETEETGDGYIIFETNGNSYYGVVHHTGRVDEATEVSPGAPDVTLDMTPDELADAVFTEEDWKYIEDGIDIHLKLTIEDITDSVSEEDKQAVLNAANGYTVGEYVDIELLKQIGDRPWENIHETRKTVRITIDIPEKLLGITDRSFAIVRVHENGAIFLNDLDNDPDSITFETDRFSTYAIMYKDPGDNQNPPENPSEPGVTEPNGEQPTEPGDNGNNPTEPNGEQPSKPGNNNNNQNNQNNNNNNNNQGNNGQNNNQKPASPQHPDVPQTGDNSYLGLWLLILMMSFIGVSAIVITRSKSNKPVNLEDNETSDKDKNND